MLISEGYIDFESSRGILIPREMMYGKYNCFVEVDIIDLFEVRWQSYAQMKTKRTLLQWAGHLTGALFFILVALVPTGIYAIVWWLIPKTFWPILWTVLGGIVWLVVQVVWAFNMAMAR